MLIVYQDILKQLLGYDEFRLGLQLYRALLFACVAVLVLLAIFHTLYYLGQRTPIYRKKAPMNGWNRRFFSAIIPLLGVLLLVSWGIEALLTRY